MNQEHVDVVMKWGGSVMGVERLSGAGVVSVGAIESNSFQLSDPSIPAAVFPLVTRADGLAVVRAPGGVALTVNGEPAAAVHVLARGEHARLSIGAMEFHVQYSRRFFGIELSAFQAFDFLYAKVLAGAMIFQAAFVVAMLISFASEHEEEDLSPREQAFAELSVEHQPRTTRAQTVEDAEVFTRPKARPASKASVHTDRREEARKLAMDALAALGLSGSEGVSNVFGPSGLTSGVNVGLSGLSGANMGELQGIGGIGLRGAGAGGVALGIGTLGSGTGLGSDGLARVDLRGRGQSVRVRTGNVVCEGALSREEIQRVVKRAERRVRYCYEKELQKTPTLRGKLVETWVISPSGLVSSVKTVENTSGNDELGRCVNRVVRGLRFPHPRGGGQVFVSYPWVFSAK